MQQQLTSVFLDAFQLTPDEVVALHGHKNQRADIHLTKDIFIALEHVEKIHTDCKILMQAGHQNLASDVMEQMALHLVRQFYAS